MNSPPVTFAELAARGLTQHEIAHQIAGGQLTKVRRGTYTTDALPTLEEQHLMLLRATIGDVDPSNVFSHTSAALIHGLPVRRADLAQATMIRITEGHAKQSAQLRVRQTRISGREISQFGDFRVTTLARTVADQARTLPFDWGVITADAALRQGLAQQDLLDVLNLHPLLHGRRRASQVAKFADARAESPAESLSRVNMSIAGLPAPVLQFEIFDADGVFVARTDFGWPGLGLVGEVDGRVKYDQLLKEGQSSADAVMAEKAREEAIRDAGWWVVRWDWPVAASPALLGERIQAGFRRAAPGRGENPRP